MLQNSVEAAPTLVMSLALNVFDGEVEWLLANEATPGVETRRHYG
jgi:hypothetical protein